MTLAEVPIFFGYRDRKGRAVCVEVSRWTSFEPAAWRSHGRVFVVAMVAQFSDATADFTRALEAALGGTN